MEAVLTKQLLRHTVARTRRCIRATAGRRFTAGLEPGRERRRMPAVLSPGHPVEQVAEREAHDADVAGQAADQVLQEGGHPVERVVLVAEGRVQQVDHARHRGLEDLLGLQREDGDGHVAADVQVDLDAHGDAVDGHAAGHDVAHVALAQALGLERAVEPVHDRAGAQNERLHEVVDAGPDLLLAGREEGRVRQPVVHQEAGGAVAEVQGVGAGGAVGGHFCSFLSSGNPCLLRIRSHR